MSGRGRGRGRAPPSGARLLLQRSAQEAGLDAGNLRHLQDITKPKLFPDFEWHSSGSQGHDLDPTQASTATPVSSTVASKRAASTIYLINKSREIHHRLQDSPFFVRPSQEVDVVRYGKRPRPLEPDSHVLELMGKTVDSRFLPEELLPNKITSAVLESSTAEDEIAKPAATLEELAAQELQQRKRPAPSENATAEEQASGELSDAPPEEEDDEEVADYSQDYYASDDEDGGGGGGDGGGEEATF